ncbi:MAG: bifunctional 3-(3-hydroxy-phenyl)propionate/3-hydroxycinnamic acid hydroxylase [Chloroflexi bacterium]|nr:bifunctional 3-(3-hydroxy-phenyl)propionate/3-hydroxycinnamic acid hydroxylase [Chloroflexota bacterium]
MGDSSDYDVAIVGFGPAGALAANFLGRLGHRVLVLDAETGVHPLPRAIHFDAEIMRVYQAAGLADRIAPTVVPAYQCQFVTAGRERMWRDIGDPSSEPYGWPRRLLFRQPELEDQLRAGVARYPNVTVQLGWRVTSYTQDEAGVTVTAQGTDGAIRRVCARYALGCDGARSVMRRLSGSQFSKMAEFTQPWLVVDVLVDEEDATLPPVMTQVCDPARPTTFIPRMGTRDRRWEFFLLEGESPEEMQTPERIRELLRPWIDPERVAVERAAVYTFRALIADRWRDGRVFLVGDAAHLMPPFMGQGLSSGARDAHNLAWKLDLVLRGLASPAVLDSYQQERSPHVRAVTRMAVLLGQFVMTRRPIVRAVRDRLLTRLSRSPLLNLEVTLPHLRGGLLLRGAPAAGRCFIQPRVTRPGEQSPVRLDDELGDGFAMLGMDGDPRAQLELEAADFWQQLGTRFIQVLPAGSPFPAAVPDGLRVVRDDTGALASWFARQRRLAVVVRPDRYVFAAFDAKTRVTRALRDLLRPAPPSVAPPGRAIRWRGSVAAPLTLVGVVLAGAALTASRLSIAKRAR